MKQVWITKTGGPDVLEVREAPDPTPGEGQVAIDVRAAGVNFADVMARMGLYPDAPKLPTVVGYEVAGVVAEVGPGVDGVRVGQRCLTLTRFGGYASRVVVGAAQVLPIPDELEFARAAAIPVNYLTAWLMLIHQANVRAGETVLVHAAAGGVGVAATQLCRWRGAEVIGTASASKHARLRDHGVAHCIDYNQVDWEPEVMKLTDGKGVHIVLDAIGGKSLKKGYRVLRPLGKLFAFGGSSLAPGKKLNLVAAASGFLHMPRFGVMALMNDNKGVFGCNLGHLWQLADELGGVLKEILGLVEQKVLDPIVDKSFPFEQAGDAHAYLQDRKNFGKVVLTP